MNYTIVWTERAEKQFQKLPLLVQRAISKNLDRAAENPFHFFARLVSRPEYRIRVGDYRIIVDIEGERLVILVLEVGHRKNVYE